MRVLITLCFLYGCLVDAGAAGRAPVRSVSAAPASQSASGMGSSVDVVDAVWVGKSDAATSCGTNGGISLDAMGKELQKTGVKVQGSKKIPDNRPRVQMCGVDKGTVNGFLIPRKDVSKAAVLGFKELR